MPAAEPQLALILAGQKRFDKTIIELLLNNGAKALRPVACLFEDAQRDGVDAFHFMEELRPRRGREKKMGTKKPSSHSRAVRTGSGIFRRLGTRDQPATAQEPRRERGPRDAGRPEHVKLLDRYVPNFKRYAEKQKAAANDLVFGRSCACSSWPRSCGRSARRRCAPPTSRSTCARRFLSSGSCWSMTSRSSRATLRRRLSACSTSALRRGGAQAAALA